jgi:proline racemase/trans-L-3-hydroxyproline dehydratase
MGPISTDEYHTAGEPFRIVTAGVPTPEGATVLDRRDWSRRHLDDTRALLCNEPRGHADMYGGFPTPPDDADGDDPGDLGIVFFHKDGFSTACGHGTIAVVTWAIDTGRIAPTPGATTIDVVVDVPSGRLRTVARLDAQGRVESVRFRNVPSFVTATDVRIDTSLGPVVADLSFGGAFYASVPLDHHELSPDRESVDRLIGLGREVKAALARHPGVVHPADDRLSGCYGVIFHETVASHPLHQRNVTVFADGEVDRSPCGSGTSARLALLHHHGTLAVGERFVNEGIAGGRFEGRVEEVAADGVVTSVEGSAYRTGRAEFTLDERDPIAHGFQLR